MEISVATMEIKTSLFYNAGFSDPLPFSLTITTSTILLLQAIALPCLLWLEHQKEKNSV